MILGVNSYLTLAWLFLAANLRYDWIPGLSEFCRTPLMDLGFVSLTAFMVVTYATFAWSGYKISRFMVHGAEMASRSQIITFAYGLILIAGIITVADFVIAWSTHSPDLFLLEALYDLIADPISVEDAVNQSLEFVGG